jgi:hypothetical protein
VLGAASLFSGVAVLANIVLNLALPVGLLSAGLVLGGLLAPTPLRSDPDNRRHAWDVARSGLAAGVIATLAYDIARAILSLLDPSAFRPFEVMRTFGRLLLGETATANAMLAAGTALHLVNGTCFGLAYAALFGRDGRISRSSALVTGMTWGLFLEGFQLVLYPSWLRIAAIGEFATISAASHLVFGTTAGMLTRRFLRIWAFDPLRVD